jgi:sugar lactone lactonase YvrE
VLALASLALATTANGQSTGVTFSENFVPTLPIPAVKPHRMAVDGSGNIFIADDADNQVLEVPAAGGIATAVLFSGLKGADGIAVDGMGNVYIGDYGSGVVVEISPAGTQATLKSGLGTTGINLALDSENNLFVSDSGNNQILEMLAAGSSWAVVPTAGLSDPLGIAVDRTGNVYVADHGNNRVVELPWSGKAWGTQAIVGSGLLGPEDVKVDRAGNVLICDTGNNQVVMMPASGGTQRQVEQGGIPVGLGIGNRGEIYVATTNQNQLSLLNLTDGTLGWIGAGQTQTAGLVFAFSVSTTLQSITATAQGTAGLAFGVASGGTCTANTQYAPGNTCTVALNFAPTSAGPQAGALVLTDSNSQIVAQVFLSGNGTGPAVAFNPGSSTALGVPGLDSPEGTAVDAVGDVYIADFANDRVVELVAGGGTPAIIGNHLSGPSSVAVDGAGNVYVADAAGNEINEILAGSTSQISVGSGFNAPVAVAADRYGNLYVADSGNNRVVKLPVNGGVQSTVGTGLSAPAGAAIDSIGNIYVADSGNNRVLEIPVNGSVQTAVGAGLSDPHGVAVDAALNLYIADTGNNRVVMVAAGDTGETSQTVLASGLKQPIGLSVDSSGNLYIGDTGNNRVLKINRAGLPPPTLSFANTTAGTQSSDSPKDEIVQNIGTQPLALSTGGVVLSDQVDFGVNLGSQTDYCLSGTDLNPGASCMIEGYFTPTKVGSLTATVTLNDNALNVPGATQTIALSGTAMTAQKISFTPPPSPVTYGVTSIKLVGTASSGLAVTFGATGPATLIGNTLKITGADTVVVTASQPGNGKFGIATPVQRIVTVNRATLTVIAANASRIYSTENPAFSDNIAGFVNGDKQSVVRGAALLHTSASISSQAGIYPIYVGTGTLSSANYTFKLVSGTMTIRQAKPVIIWAEPEAVVYGTALSGKQLDASSRVSGKFTYTPALGTILKAGLQKLAVSFEPTDARDYAAVASTADLTVKPATLTITASNAIVAYNHTLPSLTYTATGYVDRDTSSVLKGAPLEKTTAKFGSTPGTYPIEITQGTLVASDYDLVFKDGTLSIIVAGEAATPVFKPSAGTYSSQQTVTIIDPTPRSTIYYTAQGTEPTAASTRYTSAGIKMMATETIKALALATGYTQSATYKIAAPSAATTVADHR